MVHVADAVRGEVGDVELEDVAAGFEEGGGEAHAEREAPRGRDGLAVENDAGALADVAEVEEPVVGLGGGSGTGRLSRGRGGRGAGHGAGDPCDDGIEIEFETVAGGAAEALGFVAAEIRPGFELGGFEGGREAGAAFREGDFPGAGEGNGRGRGRRVGPRSDFRRRGGAGGAEDERLAGRDLEKNFKGAMGGGAAPGDAEVAVEWIHHEGSGGGADRDPAFVSFRSEVGDEVIATVRGGAADEVEAGIGQGFAAGVGSEGGEDVGVDGCAGGERGEGGFELRAALGEAAEAGDVFGEFFEEDFRAARGEGGELLERGDGHAARGGDDDHLVTRVAAGEEGAGVGAGLEELGVGNVVEGVALLQEGAGEFADGLVREPLRVVDGEHFYVAGLVVEEVGEGPVEEDVVVGRAALENGLDAGDVAVEGAEVVPPRVLRMELGGGVEEPAGPGGVLGRVDGPVVENVVDAVGEDAVELGLHEGERLLPVIAEPGGALGGGEGVAGDVGGGGGEADDEGLGEILVVVGDVGGVAAEAGDGEGRGAEDFGFGDVGVGVEVEEVAGGAVGLVADEVSAVVRPLHPGAEVVEVELGEGFAVVALDAAEGVGGEGGEGGVAGFGEEGGGVGLEVVAVHRAEFLGELRGPVGAVVFEGVVELAADEAAGELVGGEGLVEFGEVTAEGGGGVGIEDEAFAAGGGAFDKLFRGLGDELAGGVEDGLLRGVGGADPGAAEGPAGAGGHIDAEAEAFRFGADVGEHLDPFRREVVEVAGLGAFRAVNRGDLDAAETGGGELLELAGEVAFVDAAAGPPPAGPGFVCLGDLGPAEGVGRGLGSPGGAREDRDEEDGQDEEDGREAGMAEGAHGERRGGRSLARQSWAGWTVRVLGGRVGDRALH